MSDTADAEPVDHQLERMIFFSDAVFAIAITLLVIEIDVPHLHAADGNAAAWRALAERLPSFFGYALSFIVIGRLWMAHHSVCGTMARYDPRLLWPNLMLLMAIAFMPFATGVLSANLGQFVPTLFYNAVLMATSLLNLRVVRGATAAENSRASFGDEDRILIRARGAGVVMAAALTLALTFAAPLFSQLGLATIPLWQRLARRRRIMA